MDSNLANWLTRNSNLVTARELLRLGLGPSTAGRLVESGQLIRIQTGALVLASYWQELPHWERHRVRAIALIRAKPDAGVCLSHQSALALSGVPLYGVSDRTHVMLPEGKRRRPTARLRFHLEVSKDQIVAGANHCRASDVMAALQVADAYGVEAGLVSADAIAAKGIGKSQFIEALSAGRFEHGLANPSRVAQLVDGRMESPGETRCRFLLHMLGYRDIAPQHEVRLPNGRIARLDFLLASRRTVVEFDGAIKYGQRDDLTAEKAREDGIRALGLQVVRLTWPDLSRPQQVRSAIEAASSRAWLSA
ncbi:type IV toxin-antitoxin system AbiEi family antitoxin domain-containing protein [Ornithinimicrobium sp. Arc0846-15]|nr:type IV toxin-antitoxin system AbiEi family antitoxin domain-containing protein [Ornithinimicrobium laminariae]